VGAEVDTGRHVPHPDELRDVVVLGVQSPPLWSGERDVVGDAVQRELRPEGRARRERRGDARDDVRRDALVFQRVHLFDRRAVDRRVAAVEADDVPSVLVGVAHQRD